MKILILSSAPERNRQAMDLCFAISDRGHEIVLITPGCENEKIWLRDNLLQIKLKPLLFRCNIINKIPFIKGVFNKFRFLVNVFKKRDIDLAFAVNEHSLYVLCLLRMVVNFDLTYYPLEVTSRAIYIKLEKLCSKNVKCFIIPEENRKNLLIKRIGCVPEKVYVVYNTPRKKGRIKRTYKISEYLMIPKDQKVVLLQGSYQRYLQIENIINAFDCIKREIHLVLQIVNYIPPHILEMVKNAGDNVHLVPSVSSSEVEKWVSSADLGLLPYEDDSNIGVKYCSPQKMFDYLSCGVPILGSARPLIKNIINGYEVGRIVGFGNKYEISNGIKSFFECNEFLDTASINAYSVFSKKYNYDKMLEPVFGYLGI